MPDNRVIRYIISAEFSLKMPQNLKAADLSGYSVMDKKGVQGVPE